jgi:predicted transcriptional regulator
MFFQESEPKNENVRRARVEINNSLYRQILAAETKYYKFQDAMENWLDEAEAGRLQRISDGR